MQVCGFKTAYIAFAAFVLVPVCWIRDFTNLAAISLVANFFLLTAIAIIFVYCYKSTLDHPEL